MEQVYSIEEFKDMGRIRRQKTLVRKARSFFRSVRAHFSNSKRYKMLLVTLTFRDENTYENSRYAIRDFLNLLKIRMKRDGVRLYCYFWVLELQNRGVPHYHVFLVVDAGYYLDNPDDSGWVFGMSNVKVLDNRFVTWKYFAKYLTKSEVSKEENFFLKGKRIYTMFVDKAYKDKFFFAVIASYNYFRRMLCVVAAKVVKKVNGFYEVGPVKIKNLVSIVFFDGSVNVDYGGILLRFQDVDIVVDCDYIEFFEKLKGLIGAYNVL